MPETSGNPEQNRLEALIQETVFRNEENGYSVVEMRAGRESVTVVGTLPALAAGEQVVLQGGWVEHPQYGRQWKTTGISYSIFTLDKSAEKAWDEYIPGFLESKGIEIELL